MSAELAATPSNFDAHLSSVGDTPADTGSNDSGAQEFHDSTGPSNTNAWKGDLSNAALQPEFVNPEHKAADDEPQSGFDEFSGEQTAPDEQQPEQQDEQAEDDQQTPEGMPPYEQLQEMFKVTQSPDLHQYFYDKLVPVTINGTTVPKPVSELAQGYMRMSDYSRGKQEVTQAARQAQEAVQNNRMFLQRLQDPKMFRATIKRLGPQWEQSFHKAAESYAQEKLQYLQMSPADRAAFDADSRARAAEERAAEIEARLQRQEQQQNSPAAQYEPVINQTLQAYVPQAWQRHGIVDNNLSRGMFAQHVRSMWDRTMEGIPDAIERASVATAEQLQDLVRRYGNQPQITQPAPQQRAPVQQPMQRQQPQSQPLPPRRVPAGPVNRPANSNGRNAPDKRYSVSNADEFFRQLDRR